MPLHVDWMIPDRVLYAYLWGEAQRVQLLAGAERATQLVQPATSIVHGWVDIRHVTQYPPDVVAVAAEAFALAQSNMGDLIIIADQRVRNLTSQLQARLPDHPIRVFQSLDEAFGFLQSLCPKQQLPSYDEYNRLLNRLR